MTEHIRVPGRRLGRRTPDTSRPSLRLSNYLTGVVPAHPQAADHFARVQHWILGANDRYGDCGPVSVANNRLLTTAYLTSSPQVVSQDDIFDLYRRSGNPGFDPVTDANDNGVDMSVMLSAVLKDGIAGVRALAFAKVDQTNLDEVRAAIAIFGSVLYGVDLEVAQQAQQVWDYSPSAQWGGHAVVAGRYSSAAVGDDIDVISWANVIGTTDAFAARQLSECWCVVWPEHLGSVGFLEGVDLAALAADYRDLTGRMFPAVVPPDPNPAPKPWLGGCATGALPLFVAGATFLAARLFT